MADLKRDLIKYCRDKAKSKYVKASECYICGSTTDLEFHHYNSMTAMLNKWLKGKLVETAEDIMSIRDEFISIHHEQIYDKTVTLCKTHHAKLHKIYGVKPSLATAGKQSRWVERQHEMAI